MIEIKVEGLAELRDALLNLPKELQRAPLRGSVMEAAKVVQKAAAERAPVDSGVLKRSVYRKIDKAETSAVQTSAIVGVRYGKKFRRRGQDGFYFPWVEFGTSKMGARPFVRPAFEATVSQQIEAMRLFLVKAIERAAAKLRK